MTEEIKNIEFVAACIEGDKLYGAGIGVNILFKYDLIAKTIERLGVFEGFKIPFAFDICKIFKYEGKLYCFSRHSYEVAMYCLEKDTFTYYRPESEKNEAVSIRCVCCIGNDVWMFREARVGSILVFSMERGCYSEYEVDTSVLNEFDFSFYVGSETCLYFDKHIWRCLPGNNVLLGYDLENFQLKIIELEESISSYTVSCAGKTFFVLGRDGKKILTWKPDTRERSVWETGYEGIGDRPFREVICKGNYLFLIPCFEERVYCYEIYEDKLCFKKYIEYPEEVKRLHNIGSQSMFVEYTIRNENELYLFPFGGNGMLWINLDSHETKFYSVQISEEDYVVSGIKSEKLLYDNQATLEYLMDYLMSIITNREKSWIRNDVIGCKCWKQLNGELI